MLNKIEYFFHLLIYFSFSNRRIKLQFLKTNSFKVLLKIDLNKKALAIARALRYYKLNFYLLSLANSFFIFTFSSSAKAASTKIRPLCSSVITFLREAISTCTCGGIVKKEPPEAPRSIATTAKPFFTLFLILW